MGPVCHRLMWNMVWVSILVSICQNPKPEFPKRDPQICATPCTSTLRSFITSKPKSPIPPSLQWQDSSYRTLSRNFSPCPKWTKTSPSASGHTTGGGAHGRWRTPSSTPATIIVTRGTHPMYYLQRLA
jgi:hypothetical protein